MREKFGRPAPEPITIDDVKSMPLPARLAWGADVVSRVLDLYSDHFRKTYLQDEALDYVRAFASGQTTDRDRGNELADEIAALAEDAEEDGYPRQVIGMGGDLAEEVWVGNGKGLLNAIRSAAHAFAVSRLHRQGASGLDPAIPNSYVESLEAPFYRMAKAALSSGNVDAVPLDLAVPPLPPRVRPTTEPPEAEQDFHGRR